MYIRVFLVGFLLAVSTTSALAEGPYIGAAGGVTIVHDGEIKVAGVPTYFLEYDNGYGFNGSVGYNFEPARLEFEFGYKNAGLNKILGHVVSGPPQLSEITVMSYMVNVLCDIKNDSRITPYLGAGLGLLNGELKSPVSKGNDYEFGYQVIVGMAYNVNKNFAIDLSYHFQDVGSYFSQNDVDIEYTSSNFMVGLRYNF